MKEAQKNQRTSYSTTLSHPKPYSFETCDNPPAPHPPLAPHFLSHREHLASPPSKNPPTPTGDNLAPTAVLPYASKAAYTAPHRFPVPTTTLVLTGSYVISLIRLNSTRTPPSTFDHPGLGEWPPLRTAKGASAAVMACRTEETSAAERGDTMHSGVAQAEWSLSAFVSILPR